MSTILTSIIRYLNVTVKCTNLHDNYALNYFGINASDDLSLTVFISYLVLVMASMARKKEQHTAS